LLSAAADNKIAIVAARCATARSAAASPLVDVQKSAVAALATLSAQIQIQIQIQNILVTQVKPANTNKYKYNTQQAASAVGASNKSRSGHSRPGTAHGTRARAAAQGIGLMLLLVWGGACTTRVRRLRLSPMVPSVPPLIALLASPSIEVQLPAAGAVGHVAMRGACSRCSRRSMLADDVSLCGGVDADQVTIAAAGAVPLLIALLASPSTDVQKVAAEEPRCQRQRVRSGGRVML
jgi:hypothetical protein